jgi:hypothetical protein
VASLWLGACAEIVISAGSMVAGAGVNHALGGITYKTFTAPLANTRLAALKTLSRMDMTVTGEEKTDSGWEIEATAADRDITVELESLTQTTTRMRVVADEGLFFLKDSATAAEIIVQTAQTLQHDAAMTAQADY